MQAYLRIYRIDSNISLPTQALKLYPSLTKTSSYSSKSYFKVKSLLKLNTFDLVLFYFVTLLYNRKFKCGLNAQYKRDHFPSEYNGP